MNHDEVSNLLDQKVRGLQKELKQLKKARRALRSKARLSLAFQQYPLAG
ncbi:MAG: hypothetical protein GPJ51_09325 [Candidatus Heimdallarchaeota archaeon]|nr:hypothetical protein [Candidatus Heimdallarchaeota archaeon]